jgi:hypothetical protein
MGELDMAFAILKEIRADAVIVGADPYFTSSSSRLRRNIGFLQFLNSVSSPRAVGGLIRSGRTAATC